jgi:hypothetical protein
VHDPVVDLGDAAEDGSALDPGLDDVIARNPIEPHRPTPDVIHRPGTLGHS